MAEEQKYTLTTDKGEQMTYSAGYSGKGVAVYPNGDVFDGEFVDGVRQGKGKYTYGTGENPDRYEGQFYANEKHGVGRMFYTNRGEYFGNFVKGKRNGEGMFTYQNKDIYSGQWKNGKKHGKGTYYTGNYYEGKLVDGSWKLSNGQTYQGEFKNNQPVGKGTWGFANGNKVEGCYNQQIIPKMNEQDKINIKLEWTH